MKTLNILIVDDDRHLAETTSYGLQNMLGEVVHVDVSFNGDEALSCFTKKNYDVVISDFNMPGISGLELLTQIRLTAPEVVLVLMTAYGTDEIETQARKLTEIYLTKPFELSVLVDFIKSLIEGDVSQETTEQAGQILLLEDDKYLQRLISKVLKNSGFELTAASTIKEAKNFLETSRYDVLVFDIQVPDGLGIDLVKDYREKLTSDGTTVIIITGEARYRYQEEELGIDMFLEKPISVQDLVVLVQRLASARNR